MVHTLAKKQKKAKDYPWVSLRHAQRPQRGSLVLQPPCLVAKSDELEKEREKEKEKEKEEREELRLSKKRSLEEKKYQWKGFELGLSCSLSGLMSSTLNFKNPARERQKKTTRICVTKGKKVELLEL